ncbi:MAG TPA: NADH-quinone oxidoreductase subunit C [bacterium]|nr:NADH-quinone oxidoreductase subunit C [bacterium]HPN46044.1 NADH-quinone oxidoreductase subunit C [bacterium]
MADCKEFLEAMGNKIHKTIDKKGRLYFEVNNDDLHEVVKFLFHKMGCRLSTATATEMYHGIEVLYHFSHDATGQYYCPRVVMTNLQKPVMNSITPIIRGAEWIEREMAEFWGIEFIGHPRPERLLSKDHPQGLDKPLRFRRMS